MTATTAQNTEHAQQATDIARLTRAAAENSVQQMDSLNTTIYEINASSADIGKINKTINEIAFQTRVIRSWSLWAVVSSDGKETQPTCMGIGVGGDLSVRMLL